MYGLTGVVHRFWPKGSFLLAKELVNNSADLIEFNPGPAGDLYREICERGKVASGE